MSCNISTPHGIYFTETNYVGGSDMENYNKGEFVPEQFRICVCDKKESEELSEEFTLPDYQPEINKLLKVDAVLTPPVQYIGSGKVELSGSVCYDVLYCGEDGQLYSSRVTSDYSMSTDMKDTADADMSMGVSVCARVYPEGVTGRVTAPRKISMRTRLGADVKVFANSRCEESIGGLDDTASLRRLLCRVGYADVMSACDEAVTLGDEIIIDRHEGDVRVIWSNGKVFVSEATATDGGIICRGELLLSIMMCRDGEGKAEIISRKIPFTHEIAATGVTRDVECRAWGDCQIVNVSVQEGRLGCEAVIALYAEAQTEKQLIYPCDIYSTEADASVEYEYKTLTCPIRAANGNFTQSGVFETEQNALPPSAAIICVDGNADISDITTEGRRCIITGEVKYDLLYADGDEFGRTQLTSPWRYEADMPIEAKDAVADAALTVTSCRARMDGERVSVDSEIAVAWRACRPVKIKTPGEVKFTYAPAARRGELVVCYPATSDTLWGVARRYRADAARICENNALSKGLTEPLDGVGYLIV